MSDLRSQLQDTLGATYTVDRELGGGGMSRVFMADERRLNRKVVIKVLSPELAEGLSGERFEREIQLAASLQQANIVPILAAGETVATPGQTKRLPFYTMPYVEGESLRVRVGKDGPLPVPVVVGVIRDVAKALAYAHERGVVHRDIKPDNVLLSGGTAVVTDFGIAKAISAARTEMEGATLTQLGTSIGTPAYMSPEQAAGDPTIDHRADIYSLGCMAYELLTGHVPFHGRPAARMLAAHMAEIPAPVSAARPDVPPALEQLVMRCLEKDPASRPHTGLEIVQALDSITSGNMTSASAALLAGPGMLKRSLGIYVAALAVVLVVTRAAIIALGLPDWVLPGALVVMAFGLPAILFTWYVNRTMRRVAMTTPALTPGGSLARPSTMTSIAIRASPHVTWRRAWLAGSAALAAFVVVVAAFMLLRALGIGPAGSLLAAGKLGERERVILTDFQSPDSSLGTIVNEAVRTNLSQSRVLSIMPPAAIAATLQRMQRPKTSRVDLALAREIAEREGVKAIVDGAIRSLGTGYVVSLRLVSADSASELAAYQETADSPRELLQTIDKLTRDLRGKVGESLREIRGNPPLEQVTTPSLEALRKYAEGQRQIDVLGEPLKGADLLREAIKIDTAFAMAWRKLGVALNNSGRPRVQVDSALEKAYHFRDRLTDRERLLAEATYFHLGPGRDRRKAIEAYQAILQIDPNDVAAANNLGNIYSGRREFARAESLYKRIIATGRAAQQHYMNLIPVLFNQGKQEEAERVNTEARKQFPTLVSASLGRSPFFYQRGQLDSMEALLKQLSSQDNIIAKINGSAGLAQLSLMRGQISELYRHVLETRALQATLGQPFFAINDSMQASMLDLMYYDDTARAVRRMDVTLAKTNIAALPRDARPYGGLASFYARVGQPARARAFLAQDDAEVTDTAMRRNREASRHGLLGTVLLGEGKPQEALREFWRSDTTYDGPNGNCAFCIYRDVGLAWLQAGVADSAIYYWERYLTTPWYGREGLDAGEAALLNKRLGELYDAKGDVPNAVRHYREFVRRWEHADAKLQPKVQEVRRRLSRMADVERK